MSLPDGSMGPKVSAACDFVESTHGRAVIGALDDLPALLAGTAGTTVVPHAQTSYQSCSAA
jgi:carbamate kinase